MPLEAAIADLQPCYEITENAPHIGERYRRIALVSHARHMAAIDRNDTDTLIVTHGWLLWHQALAEGRHAVHYESQAGGSPVAIDNADIYVRAHDWTYIDGKDATMFRGVSLGRRLGREISLVIMELERLRHDLATLIARYHPQEIVYYDFRSEYGTLDDAARRRLVREYCEINAITYTDCADPADGNDSCLPFAQYYGSAEPSKATISEIAATAMRQSLEWLLVGLSRLASLSFDRRPAVLIASTHLTARPLIDAYRSADFRLLVLANWYPRLKSVGLALRNLFRGVHLVSERASLDARDEREVHEIVRKLETHWATSRLSDKEREVAAHIRREVLESGRLRELAREVRTVEKLLLRHKPKLVFSDGMDFYLCHIFFIVAKRLNLKTAVTWHGPFIQDVRMDILGGDPRIAPVIDRFFTWGSINEAWLQTNAPHLPVVRTGNPIVKRPARLPARVTSAQVDTNVLLLAFAGPVEDNLFCQAPQYPFFVKIVTRLRSMGYRHIRMKVHPGAYSATYYRDVARFFGIECDIYRDEPFQELAGWADLVIGPAGSGAMAEVLSLGKPYYPLQLLPSAANLAYLQPHPIYTNVDGVCDAIANDTHGAFDDILDALTGVLEIPDPAVRTWEVIEATIANEAPVRPSARYGSPVAQKSGESNVVGS